MKRRALLALGIVLCLASAAQATPMILEPTTLYFLGGLSDNQLLPNTPGQVFPIYVSGGDQVAGINFNAQIGDGGPLAGGVDITPQFVANLLAPGAIFATNNTGQVDAAVGFGNSIQFLSTTTASGTVAAQGLLATLTFDTTGLFAGIWPFSLEYTLNGPTNFATSQGPLYPTFGFFIPEPSSLVLGLFAAAGLGAVAVRKQRARRAA